MPRPFAGSPMTQAWPRHMMKASGGGHPSSSSSLFMACGMPYWTVQPHQAMPGDPAQPKAMSMLWQSTITPAPWLKLPAVLLHLTPQLALKRIMSCATYRSTSAFQHGDFVKGLKIILVHPHLCSPCMWPAELVARLTTGAQDCHGHGCSPCALSLTACPVPLRL